MSSLALNSGERAIGIVIEGTLDDGTEGLRWIRDRGGLTIVQDPSTCNFCGMPESAIRAGVVDRVVAIKLMPQVIRKHVTSMQDAFRDKRR